MKTKSVARGIEKTRKQVANVLKSIEALAKLFTKLAKADDKLQVKTAKPRGRPAKVEKVAKTTEKPVKAVRVKKVPVEELDKATLTKLIKIKNRGEKTRGRAPNPQLVKLAALYDLSELTGKTEPVAVEEEQSVEAEPEIVITNEE